MNELTEGQQDNILINALIATLQKVLGFEGTPEVFHSQPLSSIDFHFLEDGLSSEQLEQLVGLTAYPRDQALNGMPLFSVDLVSNKWDHDEGRWVELDGILIKIGIEFTPSDYERIVGADRGTIVHLPLDGEVAQEK